MDNATTETEVLLSVVVPMYNERENLDRLFERLGMVLDQLDGRGEIVCVDDGSVDGTAEHLKKRAAGDARVKVVRLSRNFGHQAALSAGLAHASGRAVVLMDADLQDPPETIPSLIEKWRDGYDVVYAIRRSRPENPLLKFAFWIFYRLLDRVSAVKIPRDTGDFSLMDRTVVDFLLRMPERNRFLRGMRAWVGLRQTSVAVDRQPRAAGKTKYSYSRWLKLAVDGFVSFSYAPLRLATRIGFLISGGAFLYGAWVVVRRLVWGGVVPGFAATIVVIAILGGIQLITIGIMGEYIGRIYDEVKRRPLYLIAETLNCHGPDDDDHPDGGVIGDRRL